MHYFIGLPEWRHPDWYAQGKHPKEPLKIYARHFSSVEGNTTFYALPKPATVSSWDDATAADFRFCFKFPKTITHDAQLRHCAPEVKEFLQRVAPLEHKLGILWLQMSASFKPSNLSDLKTFLENLPREFCYGIEVRHPGFFRKDDVEKTFNQLLMEYQLNRVMFDTRTLFSHPADDEATKEALTKKPRLPLHVIATGQNPMLRLIAPMQFDLADSALDQWISKTLDWIDAGLTPYLFFHTPNKGPAPKLALRFSQRLAKRRPDINPLTLWDFQPSQNSLF